MRRSAAPSQLASAAKRPRFTSPLINSDEKNPGKARKSVDVLKLIASSNKKREEVDDVSPKVDVLQNESKNSVAQDSASKPEASKVAADKFISGDQCDFMLTKDKFDHDITLSSSCKLKLAKENQGENLARAVSNKGTSDSLRINQASLSSSKVLKKSFSAPKIFSECVVASPAIVERSYPQDATPAACYFSVVWCKLSKKKHKKWEGDALMVAKGRSAVLYDMDGKVFGKGTGYKTTEMETLQEGHLLVIGGKEIEVMGPIREEDFLSGRCFNAGCQSASDSPVIAAAKSVAARPFQNPQRRGATDETSNLDSALGSGQPTGQPKPRFDPSAPDALVMPTPSQGHQWKHNAGRLPVVTVVVDPHVTRHLRQHQRRGVVFLYECVLGMKAYTGQGAILADEMGLGKTLQCIALIWTLLKQGPYGGRPVLRRVLVITPSSLVKNWMKEFKKWLGFERIRVYAVGPESTVQEFLNAPTYPIMLISYEMFVRCIDLIQKANFELVICDEGHRLKNANIKTTSCADSLLTRRRIVLSGTPVQNDLQELFSIVDFCNPGVLGTSSSFRRVYEDPVLAARQQGATPEELSLGEERAAELNRLTALFILRRTAEINNEFLPPKVDVVLFCRPSLLQTRLYRKLLTSRVLRRCLGSGESAQHLMCISALRKLCNHPGLLHAQALAASGVKDGVKDGVSTPLQTPDQVPEMELYQGLHDMFEADFEAANARIEDSGKMVTLCQLLHSFHEASPRQKVVVVSNYTQTLDLLETVFRRRQYSWLRLDGQTPSAKRQHLVDSFNSPHSQHFVFLLSSKAGGVGLNLIGASRLVLYDIDWNPANDLQAMARVWRDGQRRRVHVYRLLTTGSLEERMYQRQISKQGLSGAVVDARAAGAAAGAGRSSTPTFSAQDLRDLFTLREDVLCATHDLLDCGCEAGGEGGHRPGRGVDRRESGRECDLQPRKAQQKNLCMDQLLQWNHTPGPEPTLEWDTLLSELKLDHVTFAFWSESDSVARDAGQNT